jgi:ABC-2 type transport system ATP-binding protein
MIVVKDISKTFGDVRAVRNLSFEINDGEIVGLLGPNGAGKTTTMRIMSGYLSPDKGDVIVENNSVVNKTIQVQTLMGYLPENNPIYTEMLVSDFLVYSGNLRGLKGKQLKESLHFAVHAMNIKDVYYRPIRELSKGYKQRVGIAAALLHKPKALILDEPTEGLDPIQRNEIRNLIKELSKEHTIIISTHVMQEVEALCTRMIIINKGKLVVDGSVEELSKGAGDTAIYDLELEGTDVDEKIKSLKDVQIQTVAKHENRYKYKMTTSKDIQIQPDLSRLINQNNWTVWNLSKEVRLLEDVFRELTQENPDKQASTSSK